MKRRCITAVVALIAGAITACAVNPAVSGGLTLVFDNPDFECRKSAVATVKRIERCDTATRLDFHAEYRPHFWIKLDSTACLSDPLTGNKYQVLGTVGIEFNKEYWMPDEGEVDFSAIFPPIPLEVEAVDFVDGNWTIYGLRLDGRRAPDKYVTDSAEWTAQNRVPYPGVPDTFFQEGECRLSGRINGYNPRIELGSMLIYVPDVVTGESIPVNIPVGDDGTFDLSLPLRTPGFGMLKAGDAFVDLYLEPGRELVCMPDWDDLLQYTLDRICDRPYRLRKTCFGGELGDINRELAEAPQPPVQWVGNIYKTMTPTEATRQIEDWDSEYKAALDRYAADTPLHPHSRKLLDVNRRMLKTYMMLDYAMYRADVEREDSLAPSLAEPLTADYFAFLKGPMADSDPWLAANRNATIISNRIGFCKLFDLCGVDRLVDSKAESMLIKDLAGTDDIPFLWQIALSSQLCSASSIKPGSYTREEAFDLVEAVIGSGAVTDPYIIDVMRSYFTGLYGRQDYGLPDDERGRVVSEIIAPYRGKYILLDFWSTGCGPCRSNIEHSAALRKANREHPDFKMIFITSDDESPQGAYDKYVAANLEGETSHRIPAADFNRLRDLFRFNGIPRYILIDREGKVIDDRFSYHNLHNALGKLGVALNEAPTEE